VEDGLLYRVDVRLEQGEIAGVREKVKTERKYSTNKDLHGC
jgi:hypothetical protein